jgi:cell division septation protein DedD
MEEETSWKGHSFTLLVFTGIVVLCSIFFILGMLVGRTQGQKLASAEVADAETSADIQPVADEKPELTFYDAVESRELPPLEEPVAAKPEPDPPPPPKDVKPAPPASVINLQIGALRSSSDAEKLAAELKRKNFRVFILAPPPRDPNPFYRVQVGPFSEEQEAELTKRRLESAGYKPIVRR